MLKNLLGMLLAMVIILSGCVIGQPAAKLRIITEDNPPYNFTDERGNISGQSTEVVRQIMKATGDQAGIELLPWSQGYELVQNEPGVMLYSTARIPVRENLFKWVGPVSFADSWFYARRGASIALNSVEDARQVKSIAVYKDDVNQLYLTGQGFKNLDINQDPMQCITKLVEGKVDLWLAPAQGMEFIAYEAKINLAEIEAVKYVFRYDYYIAINKSVPDTTVQAWQKALDDLKKQPASGGMSEYEKIITSYALPQYAEGSITAEAAKVLVEKTAADFARDAADTIAKINAGQAPYRDNSNPDLYVYVFDPDVLEVANANNPAPVGRSFKGVPDMAGKLFRDAIVNNALQNGSGWEDYVFTMPGRIGLFHKSVYYKLATGSDGKRYIICAGRYPAGPAHRNLALPIDKDAVVY